MTKRELRSFVRASIARTDRGHDLPLRLIELAIESAVNQMYSDLFYKIGDNIDGHTISITTAPQTYSTPVGDQPIGYVNFGTQNSVGVTNSIIAVPLPDKSGGVRKVRVNDPAGTGIEFYPMTEVEAVGFALSTTGQTSATSKILGYVPRSSKIDIYGSTSLLTQINSVEMRIVPMFSGIDDTEPVHIAYGREVELLQYVFNLLGIVPPVDKKDDNVSEIWQSKAQ